MGWEILRSELKSTSLQDIWAELSLSVSVTHTHTHTHTSHEFKGTVLVVEKSFPVLKEKKSVNMYLEIRNAIRK
jgi:hypothetical protein